MTLPPCGRPHTIDIKYTSLPSNSQYNDLPGLKLKFNYSINMIEIFLKLYYMYLQFILLIYIDKKFPLFISPKEEKLEPLCMRHWALNFCVELEGTS